jgi:transposase
MANRRAFAMAAAVPLRSDFSSSDLRLEARWTRNASQARRLLALAALYDGGRRGEAARMGGVTLQIVRDWVLRFNAHGPAGLIDRKAPGPARKLGDDQRRALAAIVESGPIAAVHGVVRWRIIDLTQWVWEEFHITISPQTLSRELRTMGYRKLSARPRHHAQAQGAMEDFKKASRPVWARSRVRRGSSRTG